MTYEIGSYPGKPDPRRSDAADIKGNVLALDWSFLQCPACENPALCKQASLICLPGTPCAAATKG